jgi:hypothetical protein
MEKYKPSENEIYQAKESMSEQQKRASDLRESDYAQIKPELLDKCDLHFFIDRGGFNELEIRGIINGHDLQLKLTGTVEGVNKNPYNRDNKCEVEEGDMIYATIDGKPVDDETAKKLWKKYSKIAVLKNSDYMNSAEKEIGKENAERKKIEEKEALYRSVRELLDL